MESTLTILCLEDSEEDFGLIKHSLKNASFGWSTTRVESREEFLKALKSLPVDLVLSDHSLPQFNSLDALKLLRETTPHLPFILVTGAVSEEFAVNCLKLGADDYVLKKNLKGLPQVIDNAIKVRAEESRKIKMAAELSRRIEELSKLNRELDSFVYSVSHNLRAPLRSILGLINLSKTEKDENAVHTYHELMEKSVRKLDDNLMEILKYSRNATQQLRIERVDIKSIIDDAFENLMFMPGFKDLQKVVDITENVPYYGDAYRVAVVINNLVSNAVKYRDTRKDKQLLQIRVLITEKELSLEISDNGIGIEESQLPRLFRMFSRATDQSEGVGLGLYIVKEAVDLLKGEIKVASSAGLGTEFILRIPNNTSS